MHPTCMCRPPSRVRRLALGNAGEARERGGNDGVKTNGDGSRLMTGGGQTGAVDDGVYSLPVERIQRRDDAVPGPAVDQRQRLCHQVGDVDQVGLHHGLPRWCPRG